jgi:uncharacterized Fe-S cluster-containing radical SAM superfamily enzyme
MNLLFVALVIISVVLLLGVAYFIVSVRSAQNYWKERNVYTLKTRVPLLGHMAKMFSRDTSFPEVIQVKLYLCKMQACV